MICYQRELSLASLDYHVNGQHLPILLYGMFTQLGQVLLTSPMVKDIPQLPSYSLKHPLA